jgi:nitric oxide synthase oxygenase domain/subunit
MAYKNKVRIIYEIHYHSGAVTHLRDKTTKIHYVERTLNKLLSRYKNVRYIRVYRIVNDESISNTNKIAFGGYGKNGFYVRLV